MCGFCEAQNWKEPSDSAHSWAVSPQWCSCYCNRSSVYLLLCITEMLGSLDLFLESSGLLYLTSDFLCHHTLWLQREWMLTALVQARWEWAVYWLAVVDTCHCPVSLSEGKGCFSLLGGRILHSQHLLPCPPLTSYLVIVTPCKSDVCWLHNHQSFYPL